MPNVVRSGWSRPGRKNRRRAGVLHLLLNVLVITVLALACFPPPAQAQSGSRRFEAITVEDGLSQSTVWAILQDSRGFMWFGTEDGLNKYDGYTFTVYLHDMSTPTTISDSTVTKIFEDSQGRLWFGTASGLDRLDLETEAFIHYLNDPTNPHSLSGTSVSAIVEDAEGFLWVSTIDGGLNRMDPQTGAFNRYRHDPDNPDSLVSDAVTDLLMDPNGGLWIGTYEGLDYLNPQTGRFRHFPSETNTSNSLSDAHIWALEMDRYGFLWVGTESGGLNRLNPRDGTVRRFENRPNNPYTLASNYVRSIFEDQAGNLWVGGRYGLHLYNRIDDYFTRYQHDPNDLQSLTNDYVISFFQDRSGVLWIGTFGGGISKYAQANERFTLYQHRPNIPNSLSNDLVYAIHEDREGAVWVGTMDGGLNRMDPEAGTFYAYQSLPYDYTTLGSNDVRTIFEDRRGTLWIGTYGGGLNRFNRESGRFRRFKHDSNRASSLADDRVMVLYEDRRGNFWVGTRGGGLDRMNREAGTFVHYPPSPQDPNGLSGDFVRAIHEDRSGNLWVGTYNGLNVMDPETGKFRRFLHDPDNPQTLSNNRVLTIAETPDGILWIGTLLGGLNRFDPATETFRHYTIRHGLPSDTVYGILVDDTGSLWMSTNRGLSRFSPDTETFRNYDRRDGLQSYEFSAGAYHQNRSGQMYFGGVQGFNVFDPNLLQNNPIPPPVIITAFKKFNQTDRKDLTGEQEITLSYQDNFISFEFAALDYTAPEKNQYAYKLEGFDKDWVYAGTRRYASYTNLRGGNYVFRVIGSNQDGVWNETGATVHIHVIPPIWQNAWFIGATILLLASASFGAYRLRVMGIERQNLLLEAQVRERTREIERRREIAEGLREILSILNSNRPLEESLECIIRQVERLMDANVVIIFRCIEPNRPLVYASNLADHAPVDRPALVTVPMWIAQPLLLGQRLVLTNPNELQPFPPGPDEDSMSNYGALLAVPLMTSDQVDGGLVMIFDQPRPFSEEYIQMALSFADHAALAIANSQLRAQAEEIAVSAERSRLARDLHDAVTQTLFATSLTAEVLPRLWERNPEIGKQKLAEIRELTRGALAEMRTLLMELRPTALEDVPLPDLLQQLCEAFTGRARVPVHLETDRDVTLPSGVKIGFYRIAQEALNNIQKHARANQVFLTFKGAEEGAVLSICDDGTGFDTSHSLPDHFGLGIMEERAQSVGAQYQIESTPGQGTRITVTWKR